MNYLQGFRKVLGIGQDEMAKKLGISRQAYSEKERGNIRFKPEEMEVIRNLFRKVKPDITIDDIFFN